MCILYSELDDIFCAVFLHFRDFLKVILNDMIQKRSPKVLEDSSCYKHGTEWQIFSMISKIQFVNNWSVIVKSLWSRENIRIIEKMLCLKKRRTYSFTQDARVARRSKKDNNRYERSLNMAITTLPRKNRWVTSYIWLKIWRYRQLNLTEAPHYCFCS